MLKHPAFWLAVPLFLFALAQCAEPQPLLQWYEMPTPEAAPAWGPAPYNMEIA